MLIVYMLHIGLYILEVRLTNFTNVGEVLSREEAFYHRPMGTEFVRQERHLIGQILLAFGALPLHELESLNFSS